MSAPKTTTIRVRRETRDRINRLAAERGVSAPELVGALVGRAEDDQIFDAHADAHDRLADDSELRRAIEREDALWESSELTKPLD